MTIDDPTRLCREEFEQLLAVTGPFEFDWCWGRDNRYVGFPAPDDIVSADDRAYVDAVIEAQRDAAEAMERARARYRAGDLRGTLEALEEAAEAERQFGDAPTYDWLREYVAGALTAAGIEP